MWANGFCRKATSVSTMAGLRRGGGRLARHDGGLMPEYKGTIEVTFTADDEQEADVHLLECAEYLEKRSLVLWAVAGTIET